MKLILTEATRNRMGERIRAVAPALEFLTVMPDKSVRDGETAISEQDARPDLMWMSLDAFATGGLEPFFRIALSSPSLKWLQTFNAGLDSPLFRQIFDRGVRMSNSNAQAIAIAEYVLAQVLSEWHPIAAQRAAQKAHDWKRITFRELSGSQWLIVGYGQIGREIAIRAKGFGARVTGVRRNLTTDAHADAIAPLSELPKLLPSADIVVLAASLTDTTRHVANDAFFAAMKEGSFLVNIGRGGLVDEPALLQALAKKTPALAILDVFEAEPLPSESPFWDHPQVRLTAHCSPSSAGTFLRGEQLFLDNLGRYLKGEPLVTEVTASTFG